jgi:peptide/nickel transport system ATP-binding protein
MTAPAPAVPIVRAVDVRKTFVLGGHWPWSATREVVALKGVDLEVRAGQVVAVVGQSGSGKTTLSRIVLGLEEPSSGEVWLDGRRWDGLTEGERQPHRVRFQYVPQDAMSALDPQQTAIEHVVETLRILGRRSRAHAHEEAGALLDRLGLGARHDALPRQMSGGEQRRVTLARVLALDPQLVVADEPTSGLDPEWREEVLGDLVGNLPKGAGCILVTHDMATTRAWCTHAVVMLDGWVIESFDPRTAEPLHPYSRLLFDPWSAPLPQRRLAVQGCPFHPDCSLAIDACQDIMPALEPASGHRVACHGVQAPPAGAG